MAAAESDRPGLSESLFAAVLSIPKLLQHKVWRATDPHGGHGTGVLLVPGFGFGDSSLALTAAWLRNRNYDTAHAHLSLSVGCPEVLVGRFERRATEHADRTGGPVLLFGQSWGGALARILAVRRPDLVRGLVMLASPVLDPLGAGSLRSPGEQARDMGRCRDERGSGTDDRHTRERPDGVIAEPESHATSRNRGR